MINYLKKSQSSVYRLYSLQAELLYVGCSIHQFNRIFCHCGVKEWGKKVRFVRITHYKTREAAFRAERKAIKDEKPKYNRPVGGLRSITSGALRANGK